MRCRCLPGSSDRVRNNLIRCMEAGVPCLGAPWPPPGSAGQAAAPAASRAPWHPGRVKALRLALGSKALYRTLKSLALSKGAAGSLSGVLSWDAKLQLCKRAKGRKSRRAIERERESIQEQLGCERAEMRGRVQRELGSLCKPMGVYTFVSRYTV